MGPFLSFILSIVQRTTATGTSIYHPFFFVEVLEPYVLCLDPSSIIHLFFPFQLSTHRSRTFDQQKINSSTIHPCRHQHIAFWRHGAVFLQPNWTGRLRGPLRGTYWRRASLESQYQNSRQALHPDRQPSERHHGSWSSVGVQRTPLCVQGFTTLSRADVQAVSSSHKV